MSGVAAIFARGGTASSPGRIQAMLDRMAHRGPDGRGTHHDGMVALGHCLLASTPEDVGATQPIHSSISKCWIAADARIDNRDDLATELGEPTRWAGAPDAALILAAYERWGEDCPRHLVGDFAFVIWDPGLARLFCSRDRFGVRSLYYHESSSAFRCASDMDALFAERDVPKKPHLDSLALFLSEDYIERDQTLYEDVFAVPPATSMVVDAAGVRHRPYWHPDPWRRIRHKSDDDYAANFHEVFRESVRCRLRSAGPVAAQVSGGLDSSSVVGEAETLRRRGQGTTAPLTLLHASFPGLECDEDGYSRAVAQHWGLEITNILPPETYTPDASRLPPDVLFHPLNGFWERQFEIARARGIRVTLTGMGGDQLMRRWGIECADAIRAGSLRGAAKAVGLDVRPFSGTSWLRLVNEGLRPFIPERALRMARRLRGRPRRGPPPWLTGAFTRVVAERRAADRQRRASGAYPGPVARELCDTLTHGYEVIFAMASLGPHAARWGAELRHPFYDLRLVETLLAFPHDQRCGVDVSKPLLRNAMNGCLPEIVRGRRRPAEFTPYIRRVLLEDHWETLVNLFAKSRLEEAGIVQGEPVRRLLDDARQDWLLMREVANLTGLELWLRQVT